MALKTLPVEDRPREKLVRQGASTLTESELLAILLRTGRKGEDVLMLSSRLLQQFNLKRLSRLSTSALQKTLGIGQAKACQIAASFELARRLARFREKPLTIKRSKDVADMLMPEMRALSSEHFKAIFLNNARRVIRVETLFVGSLNESLVHPREIFQRALEENAAGIIVAHNHPSGDPTPSAEDIETTHRIIKAGEVMNIPVLDHIIIADTKYTSLRDAGIIQ